MCNIRYDSLDNFYHDLSSIYNIKSEKTGKGLYGMYPIVFKDIFPIKAKDIKLFEVLSEIFIDHILYLDALCEGKGFPLEYTAEKYLIGNELVLKLAHIFEMESPFWSEYRKLYKKYFEALKLEEFYKNNKDIKMKKDDYLFICEYKASLSKLLVYAMALFSGKISIYRKVEKMLDSFNIYIQILDDFKDIKEDFAEGYLSYYVREVAKTKNLTTYKEALEGLINMEKIEYLDDMKHYLSKSLLICEDYGDKILGFLEILQQQFRVIELVESKVKNSVCE